ncbi:MAG TPA: deoxyribodipyrimidine photo-lyase [Levilinea sp.]|nr:deoxyribodipyrimidine photo-lyase [Levilinea sp.]
MQTAIWWIRRDLRLADNPALLAALEAARQVVPVFVVDEKLLRSPYNSPRRQAFLLHGLYRLDEDLRERGGRLIVRRGDPLIELANLLHESGAGGVFAEADHSPYARQRDERIAAELPLNLTTGVTVQPPGVVLKADGAAYTVFTPFSRAWQALPWPGAVRPAPERIKTPEHIDGIRLDALVDWPEEERFPAGEAEGQRRLAAFAARRIDAYGEQRNRLDLEGTSALSPYLRFGMISARQAASAAREALRKAEGSAARRSVETWINELVWREFYVHILHNFPRVRRTAFRHELADIHWDNDLEVFAAWQAGCTGYPVVDAGMRQLRELGWMHNRGRMITASFLVKDLLIDWRWGERHFMQHLLDGDPAANNGGWQWTAGSGTDAAPYFRVFNPTLQGIKFDPHGDYVRRYVPELASVPAEFIHEPWKMPLDIQKQIGCVIGADYSEPIVDHAAARLRALERYGQKLPH